MHPTRSQPQLFHTVDPNAHMPLPPPCKPLAHASLSAKLIPCLLTGPSQLHISGQAGCPILPTQVLQDRADFTSQAKLLSQHFTLSHHRNTALQVAHEALQVRLRGCGSRRRNSTANDDLMGSRPLSERGGLLNSHCPVFAPLPPVLGGTSQGELRGSREQAERGAHESHALRQQLAVVQKELMRENEARLQVGGVWGGGGWEEGGAGRGEACLMRANEARLQVWGVCAEGGRGREEEQP